MLTVGSLFAGIGGFDLALERAGMRPAWQVEIDRDAGRVLAHHWPDVPRHDDVSAVGRHNLAPVDVVCGGFPCQDLSVAGKRSGLGGGRSGLFYQMTRVVDELRPSVLVWENVPGLLSSRRGHDFLAVLVELDRIGYSGAWRTLDAQHFGVPQRRRRVFGVFLEGRAGAGRAAEILALAEGGGGHPPAGEEERPGIASSVTGSSGRRCGAPGKWGEVTNNLVAHALTAEGFDASEDGTGPGTPLVPFTVHSAGSCAKERHAFETDTAKSLDTTGGFASGQGGTVVAFQERGREGGRNLEMQTDKAYSLNAPVGGGRRQEMNIAAGQIVRRLTPVECCRLQGFPDDFLDLDPPLSDSAKYRCLGNAVAVPVVEWVGRRVAESFKRTGV